MLAKLGKALKGGIVNDSINQKKPPSRRLLTLEMRKIFMDG
jgi:hypothetical protein